MTCMSVSAFDSTSQLQVFTYLLIYPQKVSSSFVLRLVSFSSTISSWLAAQLDPFVAYLSDILLLSFGAYYNRRGLTMEAWEEYQR